MQAAIRKALTGLLLPPLISIVDEYFGHFLYLVPVGASRPNLELQEACYYNHLLACYDPTTKKFKLVCETTGSTFNRLPVGTPLLKIRETPCIDWYPKNERGPIDWFEPDTIWEIYPSSLNKPSTDYFRLRYAIEYPTKTKSSIPFSLDRVTTLQEIESRLGCTFPDVWARPKKYK